MTANAFAVSYADTENPSTILLEHADWDADGTLDNVLLVRLIQYINWTSMWSAGLPDVAFEGLYAIHIMDSDATLTTAAPVGPQSPTLDSVNAPLWFYRHPRVLHMGSKACNMSEGYTGGVWSHSNIQIFNGMPENILDIRPNVRLRKDDALWQTFSNANYNRASGVYNMWTRFLLKTGLR